MVKKILIEKTTIIQPAYPLDTANISNIMVETEKKGSSQ